MKSRRPELPPPGFMWLAVTPQTILVGDRVLIDGRETVVADMRAVGGSRNAVTLVFPGGHARLMGPADELDALRAVSTQPMPSARRWGR